MYSYLIAQNTDLFNNTIPDLPSESESTVENVSSSVSLTGNDAKAELSFVGNKVLISFGVMFLSIIILFVLLSLLGKNKNKKNNDYSLNEKTLRRYNKNANTKNSLSTPLSVEQCIKSFLERTKR